MKGIGSRRAAERWDLLASVHREDGVPTLSWGRGEPCRGFNPRKGMFAFAFCKTGISRTGGSWDSASVPMMTETP